MPSGTESTQESSICKRKVSEIQIISGPELEPSISHSNRNQSHSETSDRNLNEPVQEVLHTPQRKRLVKSTTTPPRSDELMAHHQKISEGRGSSKIPNECNLLSAKPQIKE
ncbi:hypothetical protein O181_076035 [Austropuccinia psidii MF-1]|uniref:Uncharacterized protein n=1 Tax=Austropuccinia psidii MF-1 TaxID=1389203 RepID=A0A9Q3IEL4_9BASI|nr:hypothetical protein [Austropuccinia psidii MF-1]